MLATNTHIKEMLEAGTTRLAGCGITHPRLKCEWLLSHVLGCRRLELALRGHEEMPAACTAALAAGLDRLEKGEPVQYVTGETAFMGLPMQVDARVLIPRPETEQLVERALDMVAGHPDFPSLQIADVGTGSGCIAIALAKALPESGVHAFDISRGALEVARQNARVHGVSRIRFKQNNLLDGQPGASLDLVVANLPYLSRGDMAALPGEVRHFEPGSALAGGPRGTELVEKLIPQCRSLLKPGGGLVLEIGETQGEVLGRVLAAHGYAHIALGHDLAGRPRFLSGTIPW